MENPRNIKKRIRYKDNEEEPATRQPMVFSERHRRYIRYALRRANDAPDQMFRLGCVIVKHCAVISSGTNNMKKTHPRAIGYDYPFLHAELDAMIGVDADILHGSTIYVARQRASSIGLAKPCSFCLAQMRKFGIKEVYYTTYGGGIEYMDLR